MEQNQSNEYVTAQVGVRIPLVLEQHIQQKAKDGYRSKSDELRMIIKKGFEAVYGYNPEQSNAAIAAE
jgi:hypothetical protein